MASPILAVLFSQAYHGIFSAPPFDGPSRFLLAIPIFLALRRMDMRTIAILQYGLPLGALSSLLITMFGYHNWNDINYFVNHIRYSDMALMLGLLSLFCINWERHDNLLVSIFKICGLLAGLYLSEQSGSRGGWATIPVLLFIWWLSHNRKNSWSKSAAAIFSILLVALLSYALVGKVQHRVDLIYQNLADFNRGNKDTSIGIRLQLWQAACYLFSEHPVFGVGTNGFAHMMTPLSNAGMLTPVAASYGRGEVHSEMLAKASELGIFGLLSIVSVFAVPLVIFIRATRSIIPQEKSAAFMGICLVTGFFIFGLTVEIFNLKMIISFYSLTVAVLLAAATRKPSD